MATLTLDSKLARALAALGGRNLFKTAETLAASIVRLVGIGSRKSAMVSNGRQIALTVGSDTVLITATVVDPKIVDGYYAFQDGAVVFDGPVLALNVIKTSLFEVAAARQAYLTRMYDDAHFKRYGISAAYLQALASRVDDCKVK